MSLEDLFNAIQEPARKCGTCTWYEQLDPADKTFFDRMSTGPKSKLWQACRAMGLTISYTSFRDHFNNGHHKERWTDWGADQAVSKCR